MFDALKQWDRDIFIFLNNLYIGDFESFWLFVTQIDSWTPLFALFFILIFYYYRGKKGGTVTFFMLLSFGITITFTGLVKDYVGRLRPNNVEALGELIQILQTPSNYSFFSGHASSSFAVTTFVVLSLESYTKWIYVSYLWPLLFVFSRIFVGVHYPSDILVGAFVGIFFAFLCHFLCQRTLRYERFFKT